MIELFEIYRNLFWTISRLLLIAISLKLKEIDLLKEK